MIDPIEVWGIETLSGNESRSGSCCGASGADGPETARELRRRLLGALHRPASGPRGSRRGDHALAAGPAARRARGRPAPRPSEVGDDARVYDTLTRNKREFSPVTPGRVGMYVCGMTVQDKPHVGHIRASLSGDVMRRYLTHLGYQVTYVYNFTDVDDRIIERANREGIEFTAVSQRNIDVYLRYADLHNILRATVYPRATVTSRRSSR